MGKAYAVACDCCSYNEIFFLGAGKNDNSVPYAVLDDINAGRYGREVRDFVLASESGTLWCERKLYRCRKCGNIEIK